MNGFNAIYIYYMSLYITSFKRIQMSQFKFIRILFANLNQVELNLVEFDSNLTCLLIEPEIQAPLWWAPLTSFPTVFNRKHILFMHFPFFCHTFHMGRSLFPSRNCLPYTKIETTVFDKRGHTEFWVFTVSFFSI